MRFAGASEAQKSVNAVVEEPRLARCGDHRRQQLIGAIPKLACAYGGAGGRLQIPVNDEIVGELDARVEIVQRKRLQRAACRLRLGESGLRRTGGGERSRA